ncbi:MULTISPECIES: hypothetical protein [Pseudomonas]|jgi:hypothetical protein|uniref:DUF2922 domain-containing protein n=1 Tax=Pseudomonas canavaninivorans TaxID=2842348 RepID=A0ABX8QK04_PSECO|nr:MULTISPECIES: hypothetical protein [Pseudomonas]MBJ2350470.1 hypothetical protein [Pseudomonas canavaninivorans]MBL3545904.1 hypothetical protein [Pseudomonas sp. HB05]QXI55565.1 hypothetical protein KSS97_11715 [Pseudomonas alvandae]UVM74688.1 hypothetical protein LOY40_11205 [Pseudomonas canavaninivorans]
MSHDRFIISFIADGQPDSRVLATDTETLTTEEAEALLRVTFTELKSVKISDVQVQKRTRPNETEHDVPGHFKQP